MGKYTVSFQRVDFGRRVEMVLYDNERRSFIVPNFEYTPHGRLFMAGKPKEFQDFVEAVVAAWNEYCREIHQSTADMAELYAEPFIQGALLDAQEDHDRT